jgi:lysine-N-methylase
MSEYLAAPHMLRFRCLGSECEDTCCKSWEIPISDADVERLAGGIGREEADAMVRRVDNGRGVTIIVLKKLENGACTKLDDEQLCSLHKAHGEDVLPAVCRNYPRLVGRVGEQLELTGRLSCPEVARLALLGEEPTLAESPPEPLAGIKARGAVTPDDASPYLTPFREVRDTMIELCMTPGYPVASRLYFTAQLAELLGQFYHRESETLDGERLVGMLLAVRDPDVQQELHQRRVACSPMEWLALQVAQGLMYSRISSAKGFERVARKAATTHAAAANVVEQPDMLKQLAEIGPERSWRCHQERSAALGPERTARLEDILARYCRSYWLQDWYTQSPNLLEHAMLLILRVTLIRFLLVAHPEIHGSADEAAIDKAAIEVVYAVSRAYDHNTSIREGLSTMLQKRGMLTMGHAGALLKL